MTRVGRSLELNVAVELVRAAIGDVPGAAACLPGLKIGEPLDDRTFTASMNVQAGLLVVRYNGTVSVGEVDSAMDAVRFRVDGAAPGGLRLAVAVEIAAMRRTDDTSRLTVVNDITLDPGTTLLAGPMIAIIGGMLLDGFSHNFKRMLDLSRVLPSSDGAPRQT